ncbi:unnamed protein product, partial [Linum tenue]
IRRPTFSSSSISVPLFIAVPVPPLWRSHRDLWLDGAMRELREGRSYKSVDERGCTKKPLFLLQREVKALVTVMEAGSRARSWAVLVVTMGTSKHSNIMSMEEREGTKVH